MANYASDNYSKEPQKASIYRSNYGSSRYVPFLEKNGLDIIGVSGAYSVPMISHSIDFPFSLMPNEAEVELVEYLNKLLDRRRKTNPEKHPWLCDEGYGNAFLVWGVKK